MIEAVPPAGQDGPPMDRIDDPVVLSQHDPAPPPLRALRRGVRLWRGRRSLLVRGRDHPHADADGRRRLPVPVVPARRGVSPGRWADGMTQSAIRRAALACALFAILCAPAPAADISILGTWEFAEATPAPWSKPENAAALQAEGKRMLGTVVTFAKGKVSSKFKFFDCKSKVIYTANSIEVDALFQGNLPEPNPPAAAARLGFPKGDIPGVDVRCLKALHTFHFRDPDTAMININRVIYTLKRR
jgi:hypothetical protein